MREAVCEQEQRVCERGRRSRRGGECLEHARERQEHTQLSERTSAVHCVRTDKAQEEERNALAGSEVKQ